MPRPNVNYVCNVQGVPITWFEIESWYSDMLIKDRNKAKQIGDPYVSTDVCDKIAEIIYTEMVNKITGRLGIDMDQFRERERREREWGKRYNKYNRPIMPKMSDDELHYHNKEKWSSVGKFQEIMQFAKRKAYEKEYIQKHGVPPPDPNKRQQQQRYVHPPPEPPKVIEWKKILGIPNDREVNDRIIKVCFRKLARQYHPDLQGGDETKMKELIEARNEAYKSIGKL